MGNVAVKTPPHLDLAGVAMPAHRNSEIVSTDVEADDAPDDDGPLLPWISPDDRLWRHPSEAPSGASPLGFTGLASPPRIFRSPVTKTWSVAVVAGVVGAIIASGVGVCIGNFDRRTTVVQAVARMVTPTSMALSAASSTSPNWPAMADRVAPSVVAITATGSTGKQTGSGVLYVGSQGRSYILTSASLIGDGEIRVTFDDSQNEYASVVGIDAQTGLAVVSVAGSARTFPTFGFEAGLAVAEPVLGVGARSPVAGGSPVMAGSISGLNQAIDIGDNATMENLVAVTNPSPAAGTPGGAMIDPQGAVFGIAAAVNSPDAGAVGQAYVIPMDIAQHVASQILAGQRVTHPWLGTVDTTDLSTATAQRLQLGGGALVTDVTPGSPAQRAGLTPSDIIIGFDGQAVRSTGRLIHLVTDSRPGQLATISYLHNGATSTATVTLGETPDDVDLN